MLALAGSAAATETWSEKPFNPRIGSRWTLVSELDRTETRVENGQRSVVALQKTIKSELIFNARMPDGGYRVTFIRRQTIPAGDAREVALVRIEGEVMNNLVIRALLDRNGKPLRVENLAEIRAKHRAIIERLAAGTASAETAAALRRMLDGMTKVDEVGATSHLGDVELLATAQNTGLKAGESRRTTSEVPTPVGSPMVKVREFAILQADAATGNVRARLTESYTEESMRAFLVALTQRGLGPGQAAADREKDMRAMKISLDNRYEIEVADGMGRAFTEESVTSSDLMGNTMLLRNKRKVTLSPMP